MPTAIKRRKLATTPKSALTRVGINAFATVSKATIDTKIISGKNSHIEAVGIPRAEEILNLRKRKLVEDDEDTPITTTRPTKPLPQRQLRGLPKPPITPKNQTLDSTSTQTVDTPTKGARDLLDRLFLSSKTPTRSPLNPTLSSSPDASTPKDESKELPIELLDLINLHAAFLTALTIHYAHNGTHSPIDLRLLCPDVARAWGKRRVILDDIRRSLGVLNSNLPDKQTDKLSKLSLSDYGHGKICIEAKHGVGKAGRIARPLNEDVMNEIFAGALRRAWKNRSTDIVQDVIEGLPMEGITTCASVTKMSPSLAKGQRRLEDMRVGIAVKKEEKVKVPEPNTGPRPTLLERLRAKQLQQSSLPPPPSKADLSRKAALGRIEEVVAVLTILSTSTSIGQNRISFTFPTVIGTLKDSFKTPMSKDEADICVRLLASDIAPEWVRVVKMGKLEALVVDRDHRPKEDDVRDRVAQAS